MIVSLNTKLKQLYTLCDSADVTAWENTFIKSVVVKGLGLLNTGRPTTFTDPQLDKIDQIWNKHFG